jgi:hypothetical protein
VKEILLIHPHREECEPLFAIFPEPEYRITLSPTISDKVDYIKKNRTSLVILSTQLEEMDTLVFLREQKELFQNNLMLLNFGRELEYLLEGLTLGAVNFFDIHYNPHEIKTLVSLFFKNRQVKERFHYLRKNIVRERKELELSNLDIYESPRLNLILGYITDSIRPLFDPDDFYGITNSIYEMLINAVEHGNLGITGDEKEKMLEEGVYDAFLAAQVRDNHKIVSVLYLNDQKKISLKIVDEGRGFDHKKAKKKKLGTGNLLALSGRGIGITKHFFDQVKYNRSGNSVTLIKFFEKPQKRKKNFLDSIMPN